MIPTVCVLGVKPHKVKQMIATIRFIESQFSNFTTLIAGTIILPLWIRKILKRRKVKKNKLHWLGCSSIWAYVYYLGILLRRFLPYKELFPLFIFSVPSRLVFGPILSLIAQPTFFAQEVVVVTVKPTEMNKAIRNIFFFKNFTIIRF